MLAKAGMQVKVEVIPQVAEKFLSLNRCWTKLADKKQRI